MPERCEPPPVAAATLWADLSEEAAREHVLNGGSLQVHGAAGTGKSHWIAQVLAELEASGRKVQRCTKTHSVASKIKGATLDAFLRRAIVKGAALPQTLWVDEFSLIDSTSWCLLNFLLFSPEPVQIILSGDWAQLPGIGSCYKGEALPNGRVEQSQLLHQLCGGARLTLTICRRSDETLFDFYTSLSTGGARADEALGDVIAEARQLFPKRGEAEYHLTISHARRKAINKALNEKRKPATGAVLYRAIPTPGLTSESQNMWLWPGLEVIACTRGVAHGLRHNVRYRIEAVSATTVRLQGVQSELSAEQAARHLRLPWASTYASAQGLEFDGRLELCDLSSKHLSRAHLLVGLSRARAHTLVQLGT